MILFCVAILASTPLWLNPLGRWFAAKLAPHSEHFLVHRATATGNRWVPSDTVLALARVPMNVPLTSVPVVEIEHRVVKHAWIASAQVRRRPPDLVEIRVTEREPVAAIRSAILLIATADGMAVAPVSNDWVWDLPLLTVPHGAESTHAGTIRNLKVQMLLKQVVLLKTTSPDMWRNLNEIHWHNDQIVATFSQPALELLLSPDADEFVWSYLVRFLESSHVSQLSNAKRLDARHPGHIVVSSDSPINQEHGIG